jgi:hypothetical protein
MIFLRFGTFTTSEVSRTHTINGKSGLLVWLPEHELQRLYRDEEPHELVVRYLLGEMEDFGPCVFGSPTMSDIWGSFAGLKPIDKSIIKFTKCSQAYLDTLAKYGKSSFWSSQGAK